MGDTDVVKVFLHHPDGSVVEFATELEANQAARAGDRIELCHGYGVPQWVRVLAVDDPAREDLSFELEPLGTPAEAC